MMSKRAFSSPFHALSRKYPGIRYSPSSRPKHNLSPYPTLISSCKDLNSLLQIHAHMIVSGVEPDTFTTTQLINLYSLFQRCNFARLVFHSTPKPVVILWNSMIRACTRSNQHREALNTYHRMLGNSLQPDKYTFTFVLKACTGIQDLQEGILIHQEIFNRGLERDVYICTGLVDMYCKLGDLKSAGSVFDKMPKKDIVTWNAMIDGLTQNSNPQEAVQCFKNMQWGSGLEPNAVSLLNLFPSVCKLTETKFCECIHAYVIRRDFPRAVLNGVIDMYAKCGHLETARVVFDHMRGCDDVSWGTMMAGYAHNGNFVDVLELFNLLKNDNMKPNKVAVVSALLAATEIRDLKKGIEIHGCAIQQKIDSDILVGTSLMTMYAKCGDLEKAKELFGGLQERDVVAWSAVIAAFAQAGYPEEALSLFRNMQNENMKPNRVTIASVLPACADLLSAKLGKSLHCYAVKATMDSGVTETALLSMYAKCSLFDSALIIFYRMPFKDIVTWNALVNGYVQVGEPHRALEMFHQLHLCDVGPDSGTMVGVLQACGLLGDQDGGTCIHGQIMKYGFESDCYVKNALIDMYAKCRSLSLAKFLFKETFFKDEICWNIMIAACMQNGHANEAIKVFCHMQWEFVRPNIVTIISILPAAAYLTDSKVGMAIHAYVIQIGFQHKTIVGNSLLDMYAKCGHLDYAEQIFNEMEIKDTISWNTMLAGYAVHGHGDRALVIFSTMEENDVEIDSVSFVSALSACRHAGLIEEGRRIFYSMCKLHNLKPNLEHYACMVNLLGRAGLFDEILGLIETMPMEPNAGVWGALLDTCRVHCNVKLGEIALSELAKLEPGNPAHYVILSSIYSQSDRWNDARITRLKMNEIGLQKIPGWSWIDVQNKGHA